jgi:hypothetical protein
MNIDYFQNGYLNKKAEIRPRTSNALIGAALGGIPSAIYGGITTKTPLINALKYGGAGALAGGTLGYLAPISAVSALKQMSPVDIAEHLKDPNVIKALKAHKKDSLMDFGWQDLFMSPKKEFFEGSKGIERIVKMLRGKK